MHLFCFYVLIFSFCARSEKSEVLNEEQQNLDRRVDLIQKICQNVSKKIQNCLVSQTAPGDVEKRLVGKHVLLLTDMS